MSWLNINQSLNSLKGQLTSFASEVLSEGSEDDPGAVASTAGPELSGLQLKCASQELEIAALKKLNDELQTSLQSEKLARKNGVKEEEASWYWDPPSSQPDNKIDPQTETAYKNQIQALQIKISNLKEHTSSNNEVDNLREENKNLTMNLEDLDSQHQMAMEKLLALKKELQKNFEILKQEHEDLKNTNDEYNAEIKELQNKNENQVRELETVRSDLDTLRHKYQNLERVHAILKESTEKFQEENQELHEEVFKLQEQVTKLEHEIEVTSKNSELSDLVPRERYEDLLKELNDNRETERQLQPTLPEESNIDDNAKSVIENLRREINDLKHKLAQKEMDEPNTLDPKFVKTDTILYLYDQYINFELPVDYVWNIPSAGDNTVMYKLEGAFKTLQEFKKDIDSLEHALAEKNMNERRLQTQIDELSTDNDVLSGDVHNYYSDLSEMKKNNDFLLSEITALKNTSKLQPIIESHEDNLVKLESELADSNRINVSFQSKIKGIEEELSEVRSEKVSLEQNLIDLRDKYNAMLLELEHCKVQTNQVEELQNTLSLENVTKLNKAIDEIDELKKKLLTASSKNERVSIDLSIAENDKILLTKQVDDLQNELNDKAAAYIELVQKSNDLEKSLTEVHRMKSENKSLGLIHTLDLLENEKAFEELKAKECDKNNTIIENLSRENSELQAGITNLTEDIKVLKNSEHKLINEIDTLQKRCSLYEKHMNESQETIESFKAKLNLQDSIQNELEMLKDKNIGVENRNRQLSEDLSVNELVIQGLKEDFEKLNSEIKTKDIEIKALNVVIKENKTQNAQLNNSCNELLNLLASKEEKIRTLNETVQKLNDFNTNNDKFETVLNEKVSLQTKYDELYTEIGRKNTEMESLGERATQMEIACNQYVTLLDNKNKEIKELNQSLIEMVEKFKASENITQNNDIISKLMEEKDAKINEIIIELNLKDAALQEVMQKCARFEELCVENKTTLEQTASEKAELINLINAKHNESMMYHNEITRLNQVLLQQSNDFKVLIDEKDRLLQNSTEVDRPCTNCELQSMKLKELIDANAALNEKCNNFELFNTELIEAKDVISQLTEKCEALEKDGTFQSELVKTLKAENVKLSEQDQNSTKELERLRYHLLEQEESHTQESMATEQKLQECLSRLHHVEERHKQSSTVYTSNSIRANQEVETIRNQMRLVEKQRDEIQLRLSEAEDQNNRCNAALTNLQLVLEQFQRDKECDIQAATVKLQNKIGDLNSEKDRLGKEIDRLNVKLNESVAGLQAATRLGDQLETKTAIINDLKEQVRLLQSSLQSAEEKYTSATSNQQDRVDKNLVKNLLLNYVQTNQNAYNRSQVLRVLGTVLDFNQKECEKLGLSKPQQTQDSLATEFVRFLEKESRPAASLPPMPALSTSRSTTPVSRKSSVTGTPQLLDYQKHSRNLSSGSQNLLLQSLETIEPATEIGPVSSAISIPTQNFLESGVTQTRNNEGAILKQVLKDT